MGYSDDVGLPHAGAGCWVRQSCRPVMQASITGARMQGRRSGSDLGTILSARGFLCRAAGRVCSRCGLVENVRPSGAAREETARASFDHHCRPVRRSGRRRRGAGLGRTDWPRVRRSARRHGHHRSDGPDGAPHDAPPHGAPDDAPPDGASHDASRDASPHDAPDVRPICRGPAQAGSAAASAGSRALPRVGPGPARAGTAKGIEPFPAQCVSAHR